MRRVREAVVLQAAEIAPEAVLALGEAIRDPSETDGTRISASNSILDRVLGKPKQTMQLEGHVKIDDLLSLMAPLLEKHPAFKAEFELLLARLPSPETD